ncbi:MULTISPECIES: serine/threonine-protein kinase [Sorangium]|uniref:Protein kinase n=1 Tax=Sorangium cellulosum (strain So ce56) TaxID=448385 RepID=A9GAU7_SORC5|nr:serine/threonine-protein kinase [Sorangium cellulosum]CAN92912.1 Protein kinase [Sorangium cellulosum So ce56]
MAKHPSQLADLEIQRRLGAGGMAEVFLAKKRGAEGTYKLLVVKRILPAHGASRRFRAMFVEEAHLATRLNHPNIVQVYEFSDHGEDGLLLSMEYVEGFDLGKLMRAAQQKESRIPPLVSAFIVSEAAKGLHYAHERKDEGGMPLAIVHRDVSPQNILLSLEGVVKIADFGIASANLFREEPGVLKGKFGYMSPEQARGERVDRRSDIYALGVVLYELLAMRSPYGKLDDEALLQAVKEGRFDPPSSHARDIPAELEAIVMRAMEREPEARFQTARDLAGAVARALLARQELVDNASVEQTVAHLLGRDRAEEAREGAARRMEGAEGAEEQPADDGSVAQPQTLAAVPAARTGGDAEGTGAPRAVREVRHVAVVTLRIEGVDALLGAQGRLAGKRSGRSIRTTLDAIAFKHGAIWSWESHASARAVVGLLANPSRAAADAASLAVDVHEALAGASEDLPVELRAAIGIVRGIAYGERDEQGHLINHALKEPANFLAERIGARTPFGKTWVAGGVYRLVRRDFRWGDAPSLDLDDARGYPVPHQMRLYALQRPLTREERMAEIALSPNDLVGRDAERADLHAAYHRAISPPVKGNVEPPARFGESEPPGSRQSRPPSISSRPSSPPVGALRGQSVARVIVGEMGIGKSALISTFLSELPGDARVLHVECSPVKSELPLATVCDVLRDVTGMGLDHAIDDASHVIRALLGPIARSPLGARIVTRLAELVTGKQLEHPEEEAAAYGRDVVVRGVKYLLGSLARHQPLVVVIDGLQWADRPSLELLSELLKQRAERLPVLVLLLTRPEERVTPFIEGLVRIELRGLSAEEQMRLVEARLGVRDGVAAVCGELVPRVAGNPFFLLEMIDALLERGTLEIVEHPGGRHELVRHDRTGDRGEPLPSTLEQLIGDRLRELPPAEHDVVNWLAVAGGPLLKDDILNLTRLADDEAVTRLCARGLCDRRAGAVDFRHPLVRDVAYLALDGASRVRMHRRLGEHLSTTPLSQGLSAAIVAQHLARGEAPGPAAELYLDAARAARAGHQAQLSRRYYERALSLLPNGDTRRMIAHEALEAIFRHLGRRRDRRRHLAALRQLAKESGHARWAALALVRTARFDLDDGYLARGLPVAQRAAEIARIARRPALEVEALTILSEVLRELGDVQGAISASDRALRVTQAGGLTPRARAEVLRTKGVLLRRVGRVQEAVEAYAEAIAVFRAVGARRSEARAKNSLAVAMFVLERFEDAIAVGLSSISIDLAIGGRFQIAKTLSNIGHAYAKLGDVPRSLAYMKRAREAHERYDDQDARADTLLCSAGILLEAGDVDAAHTLCADAGALIAVTGSVYDMIHERNVRGLLARARGDIQGAIANASEARQLAESQGLMSYHAHATAIEAASRVDAGEVHSGVLLARTALGAVEAGSSEYGIEVRDLCCEALQKGAPASSTDAYHRAAAHVRRVAGYIRDARLRALFLERTVVRRVLAAEADGPAAAHDPLRRGEMA